VTPQTTNSRHVDANHNLSAEYEIVERESDENWEDQKENEERMHARKAMGRKKDGRSQTSGLLFSDQTILLAFI